MVHMHCEKQNSAILSYPHVVYTTILSVMSKLLYTEVVTRKTRFHWLNKQQYLGQIISLLYSYFVCILRVQFLHLQKNCPKSGPVPAYNTTVLLKSILHFIHLPSSTFLSNSRQQVKQQHSHYHISGAYSRISL